MSYDFRIVLSFHCVCLSFCMKVEWCTLSVVFCFFFFYWKNVQKALSSSLFIHSFRKMHFNYSFHTHSLSHSFYDLQWFLCECVHVVCTRSTAYLTVAQFLSKSNKNCSTFSNSENCHHETNDIRSARFFFNNNIGVL